MISILVCLEVAEREEEEAEEEEEEEEEGEEEEKESVEESYRKTPPELDTAAAITNILSEIVGGDSDSRAVVGR